MVVLNRIYTRTGDDGTTALGSGERRPKYDLRVSAYGTVDETNAAIGVARLHLSTMPALDAMLGLIQNDLFDLGADLSVPQREGKAERLRVVASQVERLEKDMRGESLAAVSQALLLDLEQAFSAHRNRDGQRASELWAEEHARLSPLPAAPFVVSRMTPVEVSSQALVKVEGACYSVPSRWARLPAAAYIGVDQIRLVCLNESVTHPRVRPGGRQGVLPRLFAGAGAQAQGGAPGGAGTGGRTGRTLERRLAAVVRRSRRARSRAGVSAAVRRGLPAW